jgi:hypothetical protein
MVRASKRPRPAPQAPPDWAAEWEEEPDDLYEPEPRQQYDDGQYDDGSYVQPKRDDTIQNAFTDAFRSGWKGQASETAGAGNGANYPL